MSKISGLPLGKRVMVIGVILYGICLITGFIINWSAYGKVNDCLNTNICSLGWEQVVGKIAAVIGYTGLLTIAIGIVIFIVQKLKKL